MLHSDQLSDKSSVSSRPMATRSLNWSFFRVLILSLSLVSCSVGTFVLFWYSGSFEDALINQELFPVPQHQELASMYHANEGRSHMAQSSVSIYAVGRNVLPGRLQRVLKQLAQLEQDFAFAQTIIIDGSSTNGAQDILQRWVNQRSSERKLLVAEAPEIEPLIPATPFSGNPMPREGRIAYARNLALQYLREPKMLKTDYMIVLDLDIVGWNPVGIHDGFGRNQDWDVLCANGIILHGLFRDTYAFRTDAIFTNHHYAGQDHNNYNLSAADAIQYRAVVEKSKAEAMKMMDTRRGISSSVPKLVPVNSCFGGMALYKYDISVGAKACKYWYRYGSVSERYMVDCEHVLFHQCLSDNYLRLHPNGEKSLRLMSSQHMKLWYGHSSYQEIKWRSLIKSAVPKFMLRYILTDLK